MTGVQTCALPISPWLFRRPDYADDLHVSEDDDDYEQEKQEEMTSSSGEKDEQKVELYRQRMI